MKRTILFLCTGNSCRSQMAEGWACSLLGERFDAYSAGTKQGVLDPLAVDVMNEAGVDISPQFSKSIDDLPDIEFDYVITVCDNAYETCPLFPARVKLIHQSFENPPVLAKTAASHDEALDHYRRVRDEIKRFIRFLNKEI